MDAEKNRSVFTGHLLGRCRTGDPHRGIADDRVVAGIVAGDPEIREPRLVELLAEPYGLHFRREIGGELGVPLVEELHRIAHRLSCEQTPEGALEDADLGTCVRPHQGETPGPLHMADDRQRPTARVPEQPLRQATQKRAWRERPSFPLAFADEVVPARSAGAEAGEAESDQTVYVGLLSHVLGRKVVLAVDAAGLRAGPVLANQGALPFSLLGIAGGEAQAMAGGEEERRRLVEQ